MSDVFEALTTGEGLTEPAEDLEAAATEATEETKAEGAEEESQAEAPAEEPPSAIIAKLTEQVDKLEKNSSAFQQAMEDERRKRQHFEGRLSEVRDIFSKVKESATAPVEPEKPKPKGLPVQFDDDGNPYVPQDVFDEYITNKIRPLQSSVTETKTNVDYTRAVESTARTLQNVLSENLAYQDTYQRVNTAFDDFIGIASRHLKADPRLLRANGTVDRWLDVVIDSPIEAEFREKYPDISVEALVESFAQPNQKIWPRRLAALLNQLTPKQEAAEEAVKPTGIDKTLKALAKKPGSPASVRGASAPKNKDIDLDSIASIKTEDFMKMSESEVKKIEKLLQKMAEE